jgi:rSAM/selenodomain-associated transferase 1
MIERAAPQDALYIAAKAPRPGLAKTRLGRHLGQQAALQLYRAFLRDLSARFVSLPQDLGCTLGWYITPPDAWMELAPLIMVKDRGQQLTILAQGEGDWTARQEELFAGAATRGERRTVLIASDSPQLPAVSIASAFRQLDHHDLVLGPVSDGGYYLIGMRGYHDVLRGIPMSTQTVTSKIVARASQQGLSVGWTAPTFDIDEVADLAQLCQLVMTRADLPFTRAALKELGLLTMSYQFGVPMTNEPLITVSPPATGMGDE